MEPLTEEQSAQHTLSVCNAVRGSNFRPVVPFIFRNGDKFYDLSAADVSSPEKLERIEKEGLFVVDNPFGS
jgi:hypothetical protein